MCSLEDLMHIDMMTQLWHNYGNYLIKALNNLAASYAPTHIHFSGSTSMNVFASQCAH